MSAFPLLRMLSLLTTLAAPDSAPSIERVRLADDIYLFRASSDIDWWTQSNSLVVIDESDVTIFDTNTRPSTARLVLAQIRQLTDRPVRRIINSHWHMDHWLANQVYVEAFPGVEIIASRQTRSFMARMPLPFFLDEMGVERQRARRDSAVARGVTADERAQMDAQVRFAEAVHGGPPTPTSSRRGSIAWRPSTPWTRR